jgi:hypothetical protein
MSYTPVLPHLLTPTADSLCRPATSLIPFTVFYGKIDSYYIISIVFPFVNKMLIITSYLFLISQGKFTGHYLLINVIKLK